MIPWYNYPNWYSGEPAFRWPTIYNQGGDSQVPITAIMNVNSGPGTVGDPNSDWTNAASLPAMLSNGVEMLGYVSTNFGDRSAALVDADVDKWEADYNPWITGIFFDECESVTGDEAYYQARTNHVRTKSRVGGKIVYNHGTTPHENYIAMSDVAVVFEDTSANLSAHTRPSYYSTYGASRFAALVHAVANETAMEADLTTIVNTLGYGHVFVTDDVLPNPWDVDPTFWAAEVAYVKGLNS
jgi:hypothetical protein